MYNVILTFNSNDCSACPVWMKSSVYHFGTTAKRHSHLSCFLKCRILHRKTWLFSLQKLTFYDAIGYLLRCKKVTYWSAKGRLLQRERQPFTTHWLSTCYTSDETSCKKPGRKLAWQRHYGYLCNCKHT